MLIMAFFLMLIMIFFMNDCTIWDIKVTKLRFFVTNIYIETIDIIFIIDSFCITIINRLIFKRYKNNPQMG